MSGIKFAVIYNYDRNRRLKKDGTAAILIRAYLNGNYKYFNTGLYITPKQWHKKYSRVVHHPNQFPINKAIQDHMRKIERFALDLMEREGMISLDRLADYDQVNTDQTFLEFFEEQLKKQKNKIARSTYTDNNQTLDKLKEYKSTIYFSELTVKLVNDFINSLHDEGLSQNTVHKHFKNLRKFINLATQYGYMDVNANPCKRITVKTTPTDRLYLTEHELKLIEEFKVPKNKEHWQAVKDFFLFSCYTGLRFSDIASITREHILETAEGIELFHTAQKTNKPYQQNLRKLFPTSGELLSRPEKIIKRRVKNLLFEEDPLFVYTCRYAYVKQLKQIAQRLDVRERVKIEISSHTGRHSFGTIMAGLVDVHILKELMQHSKLRETMIYVHMNRKMIDRALDKVEWF